MATIMWIVIPLLLIGSMFFSFNSNANKTRDEYYEVISYFDQGEVKQYSLNLSSGKLVYTLKGEKEARSYTVPNVELFVNDVHDSVHEYNKAHPDKPIKQNYIAGSSRSWMVEILPLLFSTLIMAAIIIWFMRRMNNNIMGDAQRGMGFGKARVKKGGEEQKTTFADVAGADEEKEELQEIVEFLKDPKKYDALGARIPKGVLMVGPPGTGKTLLARATAGEAGVPFFSISGSDFVEMYVGVGASRVRDLFDQAKKSAPAIIFIDEIDAVGRHRGAGMGGGHDEREQTLNQLLVEMDGFAANLGIVMIAATNRPDILDPALLRPGRFDRQVTVTYPDVKGREAILKIHSKNKPLGPDVDLNVIARSTAGFTGADLENLMNESALLAARNGRKAITNDDIEEATIKVMVGPEKKSRKMDDREKKLTAYHESGHAVTNFFLPLLDPVHQVSIIPRGAAGGYTMSVPVEDKSYMSKKVMLENLVTLLGGRVAEALIMGDISTGASNDIERATNLAKSMVTKYGMSDKLGTVMYGSSNNEVFLGMDYGRARDYSEATAAAIDKEVYDIINHAYEEAERLLTEHKDLLHKLAQYLIVNEKIDAPEFQKLMNDPTFAPLPADFDYENSKLPEGSSYVDEVRETAEHSRALSRNAVKEAMEDGASMTEAAQKAYEAIKDVPAEPVPAEAPSPVPPVDPDDDDII
ncbi:MAG: ATP-dependent zinc metalloprotease FtsH [Acutalibacteraceae bacterium]|nr:ATP-dependent zinc metalloprotease FtsH [Clostridia bacterium]MEE1293422.1 ATP-dependent zinc metalloprotease FtsH [Acutalibacteraceae bacterium]